MGRSRSRAGRLDGLYDGVVFAESGCYPVASIWVTISVPNRSLVLMLGMWCNPCGLGRLQRQHSSRFGPPVESIVLALIGVRDDSRIDICEIDRKQDGIHPHLDGPKEGQGDRSRFGVSGGREHE